MAKKLVAIRLSESAALNLKKLASDFKVSQSEIVSEGIALFQMKMLYKQTTLSQEKEGCNTEIQKKNGGLNAE